MSKISPFVIHKALIGIGGDPKSVKRLRSRDLLIDTNSAVRNKSFLLAKSFINSPVTISPTSVGCSLAKIGPCAIKPTTKSHHIPLNWAIFFISQILDQLGHTYLSYSTDIPLSFLHL
ncbi:hypothetical protein TNCV_4545991 [Trichonephila clavipes]|nr:hypothetical protein TNCV_4545991 [Trichonephila clavipes]